MKAHLLSAILSLIIFSVAPFRSALRAQETSGPVQTVKGTVIDYDDQQPVAGAKIRILGTKLGAKSKADGSFRVEGVPVGRHEIEVSLYGYETTGQDILVTSGK